ncbi:conserved hypothetical protein [Arthrobacter sp. Hiyo4]|nr:conserved hypothetical protein [Arthrobacter sp. Hiyo4]
MVMNQIYSFLLNSKPGGADPVPDLAESSSFTKPTEFTVKLKSDLKWANGHVLDSKDVKFSFDRQTAINDPNGRLRCWPTSSPLPHLMPAPWFSH